MHERWLRTSINGNNTFGRITSLAAGKSWWKPGNAQLCYKTKNELLREFQRTTVEESGIVFQAP
jgi:hypothetical protein